MLEVSVEFVLRGWELGGICMLIIRPRIRAMKNHNRGTLHILVRTHAAAGAFASK